MTQKALNFIVSGMLNSEREVAEKRIAFIISQLNNDIVIDGLTDGFISSAKVTSYSDLFEYVKSRNTSKTLTSITKAEVKHNEFDVYINVECKRIVYGKPEGKTWETRDKADENYTVKQEVIFNEQIYLHPDCKIPGVFYTIL